VDTAAGLAAWWFAIIEHRSSCMTVAGPGVPSSCTIAVPVRAITTYAW
jgi:hypothetical protein